MSRCLLHTGRFFQHEPLQNIYFISFEPVEVDLLVCLWLLLCCIIQLCLLFRWKTNGWIFSFRILWFSFRILGEILSVFSPFVQHYLLRYLFKLDKVMLTALQCRVVMTVCIFPRQQRITAMPGPNYLWLNINFWQGRNEKWHVCMVKTFSTVSGEMHYFVTHCNNMSKLFKHKNNTMSQNKSNNEKKTKKNFYTTFCTNKGYRVKVICLGSSNVIFFFCLSVSLNPLMSF